ncbi:MAG: hypothetical protein DRJ05_10800, partial [Bacteroidetes bacterium]
MKNVTKMITLIAVTAISLSYVANAQTPQAFKYQTVVRDAVGDIMQNQAVSLRMGIRQASAGGTIVYRETHNVTTNNFGLASIVLGTGAPDIGTFLGIDWELSTFFIETELDPVGGSTYVSMGVSQLLSVPYALHSETSADSYWGLNGPDIYSNYNVAISTPTPSQELHVAGNMQLEGALFDMNWEPGTSGQLLQSTGTGTDWIDATSISDGIWSVMINDIYSSVSGNVGIGLSTPSGKLHVVGDIKHNYAGPTGHALTATGSSDSELYYIENTDMNGTSGLTAGLSNPSASIVSSGIYGYNDGLGYGVTGINTITGNEGVLGSPDYGARGFHPGSLNVGYLASIDFGVYGKNSGNYGYLGSSDYGVYGKNYSADNIGYLGGAVYSVFGISGSGNFGTLGSTDYGVTGKNSSSNNIGTLGSTDYGVYGSNGSSYNYGYLGSALWGVYGESFFGNFGYLGGSAYGVYGKNNDFGNSGYLGSALYGVYGIYYNNGNFGALGGSSYGVSGHHGIDYNEGYLGGPNNGVYGDLTSSSPGDFAVYGYGIYDGGENGTGYAHTQSLGGIKGFNFWGNPYTFGVAGYS